VDTKIKKNCFVEGKKGRDFGIHETSWEKEMGQNYNRYSKGFEMENKKKPEGRKEG